MKTHYQLVYLLDSLSRISKRMQEIAVMVARSKEGQVTSYPVTETVHRSSICYVTQTPAQIPQELQDQARKIAEKTVSCLEGED